MVEWQGDEHLSPTGKVVPPELWEISTPSGLVIHVFRDSNDRAKWILSVPRLEIRQPLQAVAIDKAKWEALLYIKGWITNLHKEIQELFVKAK